MPQTPNPFIHLHLHSEFSLFDSTIRIKPLIKQVVEADMPAVALTDQCNLFGLVRFYQAAINAGVKPICGVDLWLRNPDDPEAPFCLVLLIQNNQGYRHLTELVSRSYQEGQYLGKPMIDMAWLTPTHCEGLIALSGGRDGDIGRALLANQQTFAKQRLQHWLTVFPGRFYLQLARTGREQEEQCLHASVALAVQHQIPVVATNAVCFLNADDYPAHEVRVCIHDGHTLDDTRRPKSYRQEQYLRSSEEMIELFSDIPEAIENTVEIAKRCNLDLTLGKNFLPEFPIPTGITIDQHLQAEAAKGLEQRLTKIFDVTSPAFTEQRQPYDERLQIELDVIIKMGFPGYFLIVADFIHWAKRNQVPVGPGRGSGAGSLVAYALNITDLDPLALDLLFERFLNPERVSMPDFDIDFCMDKRDSVIDYVARTYGRDCVSQIITFGSMAAKAVVRDVGRVLGHPHGFTDRIAKMVPPDLGMTLNKALEDSDELKQAYADDEEVTQLIDMGKQLEGLTRNAGKHAGGVVIAPGKLTDFSPLYCEEDGSNLVTQYDKDDVEKVGLVKFDFLGLRTLTIIDWALESVNTVRASESQPPICIDDIPLDDAKSFQELKKGETTAVFQLESTGMKQLIKKLQPDSFDDITALVALFRPGPLQSGMVDNFINRKHGREPLAYPDPHYQHDCLKPILGPTYGIILYQEQVMQIAQVLAGYTLGGADLLRRAMGKKKPEEMARQRKVFEDGAIKNGIDSELAVKIFDLVEKFAGYGFNKSHSAAYALVSYQTLWLKTHYPAAFMAAVLSADMDNTDKVVHLVDACRDMRLHIQPPDVNQSIFQFTAKGDDTIVYGLGAIKGVGESAIAELVEKRTHAENYQNIFDLCQRVDIKKINRRVFESLIRAGAMDSLDPNRAQLMKQLPTAIRIAEKQAQDRNAGIMDMFGGTLIPTDAASIEPATENTPPWDEHQQLQGEKETLGLYLTGHPMDAHAGYLPDLVGTKIGQLHLGEGGHSQRNPKTVRIVGLVTLINRRNTQRGPMATVLLDDNTGRIDVTLFSEAYETFRDKIVADAILVVEGGLVKDDYRGGLTIRADQVETLEDYRIAHTRQLQLQIHHNWLQQQGEINDIATELQKRLQPHLGGQTLIRLSYATESDQAIIQLGPAWKIKADNALIQSLKNWLGQHAVKFTFSPPESYC